MTAKGPPDEIVRQMQHEIDAEDPRARHIGPLRGAPGQVRPSDSCACSSKSSCRSAACVCIHVACSTGQAQLTQVIHHFVIVVDHRHDPCARERPNDLGFVEPGWTSVVIRAHVQFSAGSPFCSSQSAVSRR